MQTKDKKGYSAAWGFDWVFAWDDYAAVCAGDVPIDEQRARLTKEKMEEIDNGQ